MEEMSSSIIKNDNQIIYITARLQGVITEIMVDTGANISLINQTEFNRIKDESNDNIPTLPVSNMIIMGATGKANKSIRKQIQLDASGKDGTIQMEFLVAHGLPFKAMIGCDTLRRYAAVINMGSGIAVSYTHLEVYKRQPLTTLKLIYK